MAAFIRTDTGKYLSKNGKGLVNALTAYRSFDKFMQTKSRADLEVAYGSDAHLEKVVPNFSGPERLEMVSETKLATDAMHVEADNFAANLSYLLPISVKERMRKVLDSLSTPLQKTVANFKESVAKCEDQDLAYAWPIERYAEDIMVYSTLAKHVARIVTEDWDSHEVLDILDQFKQVNDTLTDQLLRNYYRPGSTSAMSNAFRQAECDAAVKFTEAYRNFKRELDWACKEIDRAKAWADSALLRKPALLAAWTKRTGLSELDYGFLVQKVSK